MRLELLIQQLDPVNVLMRPLAAKSEGVFTQHVLSGCESTLLVSRFHFRLSCFHVACQCHFPISYYGWIAEWLQGLVRVLWIIRTVVPSTSRKALKLTPAMLYILALHPKLANESNALCHKVRGQDKREGHAQSEKKRLPYEPASRFRHGAPAFCQSPFTSTFWAGERCL